VFIRYKATAFFDLNKFFNQMIKFWKQLEASVGRTGANCGKIRAEGID
jgi:hypothetical protein